MSKGLQFDYTEHSIRNIDREHRKLPGKSIKEFQFIKKQIKNTLLMKHGPMYHT